MPVIKSPAGTSDLTISRVSRVPGGRLILRQGSAIISMTWSEAVQVLAYLQREQQRESCHVPERSETPAHPGVWLQQELDHFKLSPGEFAVRSGCTLWEVQAVLKGEAEITTLMAVKIANVFKHYSDAVIDGAMGWLHLQAAHDLHQLLTHNSEAIQIHASNGIQDRRPLRRTVPR